MPCYELPAPRPSDFRNRRGLRRSGRSPAGLQFGGGRPAQRLLYLIVRQSPALEKTRKVSGQNRAGSCPGGTGSRNSHELSDGLIGGQVLVGIELHRVPVSLAGLGNDRGAQHPPTTPHRHAFRQRDFRWHGKSQFHDRPFGERRLGVKENSTTTQRLRKTRHSPSLEMNRQRQVHFETLRAASFYTMFKTMRVCAHPSSFPIQLFRIQRSRSGAA